MMQCEDDLNVQKYVKVGSGHVLVVSGARVRVLTLLNSYQFKTNLAWTSKMLILIKITFHVHVQMVFVFTSNIQFKIWTLIEFQNILCIYVVRSTRQFTYSTCKVASFLRFAQSDEQICGRCSTIEFFPFSGSHTSIPLILQVIKYGISVW
jgi:hypothetical protein